MVLGEMTIFYNEVLIFVQSWNDQMNSGYKTYFFRQIFKEKTLDIPSLNFSTSYSKKKKIWFLNVWCGNVRLVVVDLLVSYYFPILVDFNWKSFKNEISNVMDTLEGANRSSGSFFFRETTIEFCTSLIFNSWTFYVVICSRSRTANILLHIYDFDCWGNNFILLMYILYCSL